MRSLFALLLICCFLVSFGSVAYANATDTSMVIFDGIEPATDDAETLSEDITSDASGFSELMLVLGILCGVLLWIVFAISFK